MLVLAVIVAGLELGRHNVGFETLFVRDRSRPAITASDQDRGRLVPVHIWYPARSASAKKLSYRDYIHLLGRMTSEQRTAATDRAGIAMYVDLARELSNESAVPGNIEEIASLPSAASLDAPHAAGRFPLFLFSEYRAPARNTVMAEYLASHGFIVASIPLLGSFDVAFDTGTSGVETHVADMRFAVNAIAQRPYADVTRIAVGGVGIAGNTAVRYALQDPRVDAIVSLDGGLVSRFEDSLVKRSAFYDRGALRTPMLIVESPWDGMDRSLLDQYRNAERWFLTIPKMREFHYLDYGAIERHVPRVLGDPPADVQLGYPWAIRYVRAFLAQQLNGEKNAMASLAPPDGLLTFAHEVPRVRAPSALELRKLIEEKGPAAAQALFDDLRKTDPQPVTSETLFSLANWFGWGRDEDWSRRKTLMSIAAESYPQSARARFALANACHSRQERECARENYEKALALLPGDFDPSMDAAMRGRLETTARQRLSEPR